MNVRRWIMLATMLPMAFTTACVPEPEPTTFVMQNQGEQDIYRHDFGWLRLTVDGNQATFVEPLCRAKCGAITGPLACEAAAQLQSAYRLSPGDTATMDWDGTYYEIDADSGCYREGKRDADFRVAYCYGYDIVGGEDIGDEDPNDDFFLGATLEDEICEEASFERGGEVLLAAE